MPLEAEPTHYSAALVLVSTSKVSSGRCLELRIKRQCPSFGMAAVSTVRKLKEIASIAVRGNESLRRNETSTTKRLNMSRKLLLGIGIALAVASIGASTSLAAEPTKSVDTTKAVSVFILMGQSNMVGMGKIAGGEGSLENAVKNKNKYTYLADDAGNWSEHKGVRNVRVMVGKGGDMQVFNNEWMTVKGTKTIGPEFGIGQVVGNAVDAPAMILKSCIGNRSLGWDLLPPGSESFEFEGKIYAGYKESPDSWPKGSEPKPIGWYAGKQYDDDVANAKKVLAELDKYYPGATKYEVAGFFFWQGEKDCGNAGHAARYEQNLVRFIKQLRKDFDAPNAKFVLATLGEATKGCEGNEGMVLNAQLAVDGASGKHPEFKGNVATVYTNPLSKGGSGNSHYGGNAETYMDVGEAMGQAMAGLLKNPK